MSGSLEYRMGRGSKLTKRVNKNKVLKIGDWKENESEQKRR